MEACRQKLSSPAIALAWVLLALACEGCASKWVTLRATPRNPLTEQLALLSRSGPKPTERTLQLLRRYNLVDALDGDRVALIARLSEINRRDPSREIAYATAEVAYVAAKQAEPNDGGKALELYGSAVMHVFEYLFDNTYAASSNPYDPQFRQACDLYNASLEGMLRLIQHRGDLRPGARAVIQTANRECELEVKLVSDGWQDQDFNRFEFASDYEVHGLRNHYRNFGLGVPLIAMRTDRTAGDPRERFYPPKVTFPVTALLRVTPEAFEPWPGPGSATDVGRGNAKRSRQTTHAVLELHDPFTSKAVQIANRQVPLETDLSTPLAYFLNQPEFDDNRLSTLGLLMPERVEKLTGLYMLEPFQPDKMPVLMVHGLWSSPVTWMEMFNDLRSDPRIRDHYQFWFYLYPSGQPFWYSAAQMREDLARARQVCDPKGRLAALDQMVLVGHSMGGLVSKLQTTNSGNEFWATISDRSFAELQAAGEVRDSLARTFFFRPNPSVRRIVTIGTPHRGSHFANDFTRWVGRKAISIPSKLMNGRQQIVAQNPGYFRDANPLKITTSIDSLSPSSRVLEALLESEQTPFLRHHNIVGRVSHDGVVGSVTQSFLSEGDGVVPLASAQLDEVASQIVVPADHSSVHRHPQSILEVRRILLEQIDELRQFPGRRPERAVLYERPSGTGVHAGIPSGPNERL